MAANARFSWKETIFSNTVGIVTRILVADPRRIAMFISGCDGFNTNISTKRTLTTTTGFLLSYTRPFRLYYKEVGSLVQSEWYALPNTSNCSIAVFEVWVN